MRLTFNTNFYLSLNPPINNTFERDSKLEKIPLTDTVSFTASPNHEKAKKIWDLLNKSEKIAIITHKDPDPDAISSGLLLLETLESKFKDKIAQFVVKEKIPNICAQIPNINKIVRSKDINPKSFDSVIVLDCDEQLIDCGEIFSATKNKINIDHHRRLLQMNSFKPDLAIHESKALSTTQVIFDNLIYDFGIELTPTMAECILTGIISDSGDFKHMKDFHKNKYKGFLYRFIKSTPTNIAKLRIKINKKFRTSKNFTPELKNLSSKIKQERLSTYDIKTRNCTKLTYVIVNQKLLNKFNIKDEESEIKSMLNNIACNNSKSCDISVVIWQRKNGEIKISLRSQNIPVLKMAEKLQGGGHQYAAATSLNCKLDEAIKKFLSIINK